jgi:uncharacterized peroxidase-related enzyme
VKAKLGKVPNLLATMAQSPAVLEAYLGFSGALDNGSLDAKRREQIALTVAGVNGCDYCASAHSYIAGVLGIDADEVARNLAGGAKDHKTAAILRFVGNVIRERGRSTNNASALNELRNEGVTDAELVEIIAAIALNIFTNYFNHIAATNVDFPLVTVDTERSAA